MAILSDTDLYSRAKVTILNRKPYDEHFNERQENYNNFLGLNNGALMHNVLEERILLYTTKNNEKIYYQYPGKDAANPDFPFDGRPVLIKNDGTQMRDLNFREIWRTLEQIKATHPINLDIMGSMYVRMAYMIGYEHRVNDVCDCQEIDMINGPTNITNFQKQFTWNKFVIDDDVIDTINDRFGTFEDVSFEGLLYYTELIAQNEDVKYFDPSSKGKGRVNNCKTHLTVVSFLRDKMTVSEILDAMQRSGVAQLANKDFDKACGTLVDQI